MEDKKQLICKVFNSAVPKVRNGIFIIILRFFFFDWTIEPSVISFFDRYPAIPTISLKSTMCTVLGQIVGFVLLRD